MPKHGFLALAFAVAAGCRAGLAVEPPRGQHDDHPALIRSAQSGPWSVPTTWEGGQVPAAGERVQIRAGDRVTYDGSAGPPIRSIHVAGTLAFAPDRDTRLDVGLIKIQPGADASENGFDCDAHVTPPDPSRPRPALEVGTPWQPVEAAHTARIRLVYFNGMDRDSCPAIVCCGGRMEFHGAPMDRTWVKLGATANVGDTVITLAEPVGGRRGPRSTPGDRGWRVGDQIIVTATERERGPQGSLRSAARIPDVLSPLEDDAGSSMEPFTEERTIRAVDGATMTLDRPLAHHHLGVGEYRGEVADLSRNVIVESADPAGVRGHTMYHRGSVGSISYAEFRHMGKEGVLGRYSLHFHLAGDTMRGSSVIGASIWDSANRWLTVHGTNFLVVRDCVGYQSVGHGFYVEDGTEAYNVFDHNLAVQAFAGEPLPKQNLPFDPNNGAGFWWANCLNTFTRNVACDCDRYGFRFEATPTAGFDLRLPVRQPDGTARRVDIRTLPFVRFEGNEAHSVAYGFNLGQEGVDRPGPERPHSKVGPDERHPFVIRNTRVWNTRWAVRLDSPSMLVDGLEVYASVYGFYRSVFDHHAYRGIAMAQTALPEAFGSGERPAGLRFPDSGDAAFARYGAELSAEEKMKFQKLLAASAAGKSPGRPELAPADAERLVRSFGASREREQGRSIPDVIEDPLAANGSGVTCGPLSSAAFPKPLAPVDDLPPATVITAIGKPVLGRLVVRGTTADNGTVKRVLVNGREAKALAPNFAEWEITLDHVRPGELKLTAFAEDAAGNVEKTPHILSIIP